MVFSSIIFLFWFLPVFLVVYSVLPRQLKNYWILLASIVFYSWGAPRFVFIIIGSTILDFYIVRAMHRAQKMSKRKQLLSASLVMNLGLLLYFKYANFFVENVNSALESIGFTELSWTEVALPIGISFYTFQTLTYAIDVYRRANEPLEKVSDYMLYIMSFPQMIAGPIVRFKEVASQITDRPDSQDDKLLGIYRFCIGLAKKVLIANVMAEQADLIFDGEFVDLSADKAWLGLLAYTMQIYFDFSGYSDMAIGLGRMMGFRFPENFDSPYTSRSISEFWRRWHITLGAFMRDYLYIPLGGNRVSTGRMYINLWLVFLLSGLWHGASWNFVIWGAYHGVFLILDRLFLQRFLDRIGAMPATLLTFVLVMIGWVFFRIESLDAALSFCGALFSFEFSSDWGVIPGGLFIGALAIVFAFMSSLSLGRRLQAFFYEKTSYTRGQHIALFAMSVALLFFSTSALVASDFNPFIYFRF